MANRQKEAINGFSYDLRSIDCSKSNWYSKMNDAYADFHAARLKAILIDDEKPLAGINLEYLRSTLANPDTLEEISSSNSFHQQGICYGLKVKLNNHVVEARDPSFIQIVKELNDESSNGLVKGFASLLKGLIDHNADL